MARKDEISVPLIRRNRRCGLTATVNSEMSTAGANRDPAGIAREMYHEFRKILHISRISLKHRARTLYSRSVAEVTRPSLVRKR